MKIRESVQITEKRELYTFFLFLQNNMLTKK